MCRKAEEETGNSWHAAREIFIFSESISFHQELSSFTDTVKAKGDYHRFLIGRGGTNIRKVRDRLGKTVEKELFSFTNSCYFLGS